MGNFSKNVQITKDKLGIVMVKTRRSVAEVTTWIMQTSMKLSTMAKKKSSIYVLNASRIISLINKKITWCRKSIGTKKRRRKVRKKETN